MAQGSPNVFKTTQVISIAFSFPPLLHNKFCCWWSYISISGHKDQLKIKGKFVPDDYLLIRCKLLCTIFDGGRVEQKISKVLLNTETCKLQFLSARQGVCTAAIQVRLSWGDQPLYYIWGLLQRKYLWLALSTLLETSWLISIINILKGKTITIDLMKRLALKLPPNIYFINMHLNFL